MRFLFVAPHPDDLEFNIPSIMFVIAHCMNPKQYSEKPEILKALEISKKYLTTRNEVNFQFKAVSMTRGEMAQLTDEVGSTLKAAEIRSQELINGQLILMGKMPDFLGFFDGYVEVSEQSIKKVYDYIIRMKPDYILGPEPVFVYYDHKDHVNTGKILYFVLKRMVKAKKKGDLDITIPKLFYYQSIYNHWFFPRFPAFEEILLNALKAHESQSFTVNKKGIEYNIGLIEQFCKGLKVQNCPKGEALRYQPIPENPDVPWKFKVKTLSDLPMRKRIIHYILRKLRAKISSHNYAGRYQKYYDGVMPEMISGNWD